MPPFVILKESPAETIFYADGEFLCAEKLQDLSSFSETWDFSRKFYDAKHAVLFCSGQELSEIYKDHKWNFLSERKSAYDKAIEGAKIAVGSVKNYTNLFEPSFLKEFCEKKIEATSYVLKRFPEPKNYKFLNAISGMVWDISSQPLKLNTFSAHYKEYIRYLPKIEYNCFGAVTGRLTEKKGSFPILRMPKPHRDVLEPNNHYFVEFDINGAEFRSVFYLAGQQQPQYDIYEWYSKNVFEGSLDREATKKRVISWLYNPADDSLNLFDRNKILGRFWDGKKIETPLGRTIKISDRRYVFSYLNQSVASDLFLSQVLKIRDFLSDKASYIAFLIHDNVVIDLCGKEKFIIREILDLFSDTPFGKYKINLKIGKNFGNMRRIETLL